MKLKKTMVGLGAATAVIVPIATVVSCGSGESVRHFNILPTYTGQADQLIALGIHSDYYPMQLNVAHPYDYLTSPGKYMTKQSGTFKTKFTRKLANLLPKTKGVSWWNQDAKHSDDHRISNSYWQKQEGSVLLYEHYLLDDDQKVIESAWAPKHTSESTIQTNFRASRDPYTRIPKGVFFGWDIAPKTISKMVKGDTLTNADLIEVSTDGISDTNKKLKDVVINSNGKNLDVTLNGEVVSVNQKIAKIIKALRDIRRDFINKNSKKSEWFYNDWFFVDFYHRNYLDNKQFQKSHFKDWIIDSTKTNPFSEDGNHKVALKALFDAATYTENEAGHGLPTSSTAAHHPIYEQQEGEPGAAPMFEGAMRDNQLYLFNVASQVSNLAKFGTPYGQQHYDSLEPTNPAGVKTDFTHIARSKKEADQIRDWVASHVSKSQLTEMKNSFDNANEITYELHQRMNYMKAYFNELGVNGKTFGLVTIAPGHGVSTIQSMSKFSFIYKELGFTAPVPTNLAILKEGADKYNRAWKGGKNSLLKDGKLNTTDNQIKDAVGKGAIFNMDDNGWFWNIGDTGKLSATKLDKFSKSFDMGIIAARNENFNAEVKANSGIKTKLAGLFKNKHGNSNDTTIDYARQNADYDLWNEGLKTPFVLHMLLDQIITKAEDYAKVNGASDKIGKGNYSKAISWGNYFNKKFIK